MAPVRRFRAVETPRLSGVCIVSNAVYDVRQEQYTTVIREMIRHEDDVTNHRIMWLLVGQGFIANAYVNVKSQSETVHSMLSLVGMLLTLSAFGMLYRSYLARGYLRFLGKQAKQGTLKEEYLPVIGWPRNRIKNWRRNDWDCPWIRQIGDLFEPWFLLPYFFISIWMMPLLGYHGSLHPAVLVILGVILSAVILSATCIAVVRSQGKDNESTEG